MKTKSISYRKVITCAVIYFICLITLAVLVSCSAPRSSVRVHDAGSCSVSVTVGNGGNVTVSPSTKYNPK